MNFRLTIAAGEGVATATVLDEQRDLVWDQWTDVTPDAVLDSAPHHGWIVLGDEPTSADAVAVRPRDLRLIVDLIAENRLASRQLYAAWDRRLRDFIAAMPAEGAPDYVPVTEIAQKVGLSRDRIYQLRR